MMKRQDATMLAAHYGLGAPQSIYSLNRHVFLNIGCSVVMLGGGLFAGLLMVVSFVGFVQHPETIAGLWFRWIELCFGTLVLFFWVVFLFNDTKRFLDHYECECTYGFFQVRGKEWVRYSGPQMGEYTTSRGDESKGWKETWTPKCISVLRV